MDDLIDIYHLLEQDLTNAKTEREAITIATLMRDVARKIFEMSPCCQTASH